MFLLIVFAVLSTWCFQVRYVSTITPNNFWPIQSVKHTLETVKKFRLFVYVGLNVNVDKIKAKCLGSMDTSNGNLSGLDWSKQDEYSLGRLTTREDDRDHCLVDDEANYKQGQ